MDTSYICHGWQESSTKRRNVICLEFLGKNWGGNLLNVTVKSQPILAASLPAVLTLESLEYTRCKGLKDWKIMLLFFSLQKVQYTMCSAKWINGVKGHMMSLSSWMLGTGGTSYLMATKQAPKAINTCDVSVWWRGVQYAVCTIHVG